MLTGRIFSIQSFPVWKNASKHSRITGLTSSTISTQWKQIWQSCFSDVATIRWLFEESLTWMNMLMTVLPWIYRWDSCMITDAFLWTVPEGSGITNPDFWILQTPQNIIMDWMPNAEKFEIILRQRQTTVILHFPPWQRRLFKMFSA